MSVMFTRRDFLRYSSIGLSSLAMSRRGWGSVTPGVADHSRPNMIFIMCDDLGYGDTGFNGNKVIRTPHLDALRMEGARFSRFYAGAPVCSPTRGACLTGRHPARYGITHANEGCLPKQEITYAEICKAAGYTTGHFGKWHLGTLTKTEKDGNRGGPEHPELYSPPWEHGFDTCFSTEALVPTWDPGLTPLEGENLWGTPGTPWKCAYWNDRGERVTDNLGGDDARVIVDRVEPFIRNAVGQSKPFLAVVWFHTPHAPVVAGPEYQAMYAEHDENARHFYGAVTAMDEQVGRLNGLLKELGVESDTMVWFCSDNGPEGPVEIRQDSRFRGSTGGLRGRKRSLFSGGVAVPALVKWPGHVVPGTDLCTPCSTLDYLPTVADILGHAMPEGLPLDGVSLKAVIEGNITERPRLIPFFFIERKRSMYDSPTLALIDNRYKYLTNLSPDGDEDQCFDLIDDPGETRNIAASMPEYASRMRNELRLFMESCRRSHGGEDYPEPYAPVNTFPEAAEWLPEIRR